VEDWAELDEHICACRGTGWAERGGGHLVECPIHFQGQLHPETKALLFDEPDRMSEEERKSGLRFQIRETQAKIAHHQGQLKIEQAKLVKLELELINRTPTVKAMTAVKPEEFISLTESDFL
jgi:hypothetical protein